MLVFVIRVIIALLVLAAAACTFVGWAAIPWLVRDYLPFGGVVNFAIALVVYWTPLAVFFALQYELEQEHDIGMRAAVDQAAADVQAAMTDLDADGTKTWKVEK